MLFLLACASSPLWTAQERTTLFESSSNYWTYVRWGDIGHASQYLSTAEQRNAVASFSTAPPWRMTDVVVLSAEVGPLLPKELRPRSREGTVLVKVEHYDERSGKVNSAISSNSGRKKRDAGRLMGRWPGAPEESGNQSGSHSRAKERDWVRGWHPTSSMPTVTVCIWASWPSATAYTSMSPTCSGAQVQLPSPCTSQG